jgi:hypothetical protein
MQKNSTCQRRQDRLLLIHSCEGFVGSYDVPLQSPRDLDPRRARYKLDARAGGQDLACRIAHIRPKAIYH